MLSRSVLSAGLFSPASWIMAKAMLYAYHFLPPLTTESSPRRPQASGGTDIPAAMALLELPGRSIAGIDLATIRKAYRKAALKWHPDRPHNHENAAEATAKFQAVKDAYDQLTTLKGGA